MAGSPWGPKGGVTTEERWRPEKLALRGQQRDVTTVKKRETGNLRKREKTNTKKKTGKLWRGGI